MKKILSIVLCTAAASGFAEGETVVAELGTVGVTAITTSLSNAIVAVSYDDLALANGSGIVVSNFVKTTNLTVNDQLAVFGSDGTYSTWTLKQVGDKGPKYWDKNEVTFTVGSDGKLTQGSGTAAAGVTQAVGTGIWLVRQNPLDANGNTNTFYIYGKPVTNPKSTLVGGKWNLVGNPLMNDVTLSATFFKNPSNPDQTVLSDHDQIVLPVAPSGKLCYYTYWSGSGWCTQRSGAWVAESPTLQAGLGCWILTKESAEIIWDKAAE